MNQTTQPTGMLTPEQNTTLVSRWKYWQGFYCCNDDRAFLAAVNDFLVSQAYEARIAELEDERAAMDLLIAEYQAKENALQSPANSESKETSVGKRVSDIPQWESHYGATNSPTPEHIFLNAREEHTCDWPLCLSKVAQDQIATMVEKKLYDNAHPSPQPPIEAQGNVPRKVMEAVDRMCTPLHESRLKGYTAEADARCMQIIRDYIMQPIAAQPAAPQQPQSETVRGDKDYAIEHAEYLAKAAEQFHEFCNSNASRDDLREGETYSDLAGALRIAIYEFRKRKDRALASTAPSTAQQDSAQVRDAALEEARTIVARMPLWENTLLFRDKCLYEIDAAIASKLSESAPGREGKS